MSAIDDYLNQFEATLPRHLRQEARAEVHNHLEELTCEHQRQGFTRSEAELKALREFGAPRKIGHAWRRATGVVDWPDILLAALPTLGITGLGWALLGQHLPLWLYLTVFGLGAVVAWQRSWPTWWYAWLGWLFLAVLVVPDQPWTFVVTFPTLVTLLAIDSWQYATLMTLPFTTYLAFAQLIERQQLVTTGWGPGNIYPGNSVWLETAFSVLWIVILVASLRAARPTRRGIYLLAGLLGTQLIYLGGVILMVLLAKGLPAYFISTITTRQILFSKLPVGLVTVGLTLYPLLVWLIARWVRQRGPQSRLPA
jgi:hypothetical protein